jgi:hypothetical protein
MKKLKAWYRKLVCLRHEDTTPQIVLERTLDKVDKIQGVAIVIKWKNGTYDSDWSMLTGGELALMALCLSEEARKKSLGPPE